MDEPTQLTDAVASHRRPMRRFQAIGVVILVAGAIGGSYAALTRDSEPAPQVVADDATASTQTVPSDQGSLDKAYRKLKAEQAAAEEAERARIANELAAQQAAAQQASAPDVPASCDEYSGNRALGCAVLLEVGFGLDQMGCLDSLWTKESNWRESAHNSSSGAHGIPQALPGSKMATFGADWETNPVTQIRWGLDYIRKRYGTPCDAWSFWQSEHYY